MPGGQTFEGKREANMALSPVQNLGLSSDFTFHLNLVNGHRNLIQQDLPLAIRIVPSFPTSKGLPGSLTSTPSMISA
jgi:hypothetical protein